MSLCTNIDHFTISAEFIPCDDAIRMFWWSPANLHWLWASDLQMKSERLYQILIILLLQILYATLTEDAVENNLKTQEFKL